MLCWLLTASDADCQNKLVIT